MTAFVVVIMGLLLALFGQSIAFYMAMTRWHSAAEQERRYLAALAFAEKPSEAVGLLAAARPDETVVAVAEAKALTPRHSTPMPMGL